MASHWVVAVTVLFLSSQVNGLFFENDFINVKEAVETFNSIKGLTWTAGSNFFGDKIRLEGIRRRLGVLLDSMTTVGSGSGSQSASASDDDDEEDIDVPDSFDAREAFSYCPSISSIKDQSNCGSCWAVSTAAAFSDRLCIASKGAISLNMSSNHLLSCETEGSRGCNGGNMDSAHEFLVKSGIVTGGDYESYEGCQPYAIKPNAGIMSRTPKTPVCVQNRCTNELFGAKKEEVRSISKFVKLSWNEYEIRKEIFKNGPVTAAFYVPISFSFYKKGIYKRPFLDFMFMGGHAVRIIGWGEENGTKYWLVANSWGREWGENGLFRIVRGRNECGIESQIHGAIPIVA